ncbi:hypothetical protein AURDEDRAFT_114944 [Auricularia subglabra TFB-10046 SS5]|nr:hypothetical protein AURDEDRAFT_114944 [Auricularia subglabra TFB-10046 SS5]
MTPSASVATPLRSPTSTSTTPKSSPQTAATPSFLARPLPPRNPPTKQIIPSTMAVSQAFLKPPKEKDLTPSLSRLQGRGFVEQRVKAARKLNDSVFAPKSPAGVGELGERKKSSLVDMWVRMEEEVASPTSPTPGTPPPPPKLIGKLATPFAKAQAQAQSPVATPSKPAPPPASAKPAPALVQVLPFSKPAPPPVAAKPAGLEPSAPKVSPPAAPEQPLGSAHTTVQFMKTEPGAAQEIVEKVFVRPKTPNGNAHTDRPISRISAGLRKEPRESLSKPSASSLESQPSNSTPLTHLTKGRPKKRKGGSSAPPASTPAPAPSAEVPHLTVSGAESASDFDSVRVRSELIKQFPSPPGMGLNMGIMDEHGRKQAFREAPPEGEVLPGGATTATTQHSDDASANAGPSPSPFAAGLDAWADRAPIGVAPLSKKSSADSMPMVVSPGRGRALPGLAAMGGASPFSSGGSSGASGAEDGATERPAGKHPRIPSTGARATVMDVAQALKEQHARETSATSEPEAQEPEPERIVTPQPAEQDEVEEEAPRIGVRAAAAMWEKQTLASSDSEPERHAPAPVNGRAVSPHLPPLPTSPPPPAPELIEATPLVFSPPPEVQPHTVPIPRARPPAMAERRRSTYEKYSSIILPPLKEEVTPVNSPQASLSKAYTNGTSAVPPEPEPEPEPEVQEAIVEVPPAPVQEEELILAAALEEDAHEEPETAEPEEEPVIELEHDDGLLPPFNLNSIHASATTFTPDETVQTLSVEVFIISGSTSTPARKPQHVFYETETVAVVYRAKDQKSGLVNSKVWAWRGREANAGEREDQKLADLAKRFGTTLIECPQGTEPLELVHLLGGELITRQGPRAHWSADNTAMHRVRAVGNVIFIDQQDLEIVNLCSASSFCLSLLGSFYVWHGRGSLEVERQEALSYAKTMLATDGLEVIELNEGSEDEMFWAMLGDAPYANAEYWQWRVDLPHIGPRLFKIDSGKGKDAVKHIPNFAAGEIASTGVYVIDGVFELFVVVGAQARGKRTDIRLALYIAENISMAVARHRPFDPVIHVLVLPSLWPLDLKALFRDLSEPVLNDGHEPTHMNVISYEEAHDHMARQSWTLSEVSDVDFLPLGVSPDMLS